MKTALLFPPQWFPSQPYLAAPTLKGYLESKGLEVDQYDLNIESYDFLLSRLYLEYCIDKIKYRLEAPAQNLGERDVKQVYRQILSDTNYLENVLSEVEKAKNVLRSEDLFFQFPVYKQAYTVLKIAMQLISFAHFPTRLDLESLYMEGIPEDHLPGILDATKDPIRNPYYDLFKNFILPDIDLSSYGLVGISIIHVGQVIPALTLSCFIRQKYPDIHISIGGSVFNRHADVLYDKQVLFEEYFHSVVLFEGELPLKLLIDQIAAGGSLAMVPNLIYMQSGIVKKNESTKSLPYDQLSRPNFDQLPLDKYFMPYPVLPYMASRGCYWGKCTFCTHSFIYDSYYRKENEERVADDLSYFIERYGVKHFTFSDEAVSPNAFQRMSKAILDKKIDMKALAMIKFESNTVENQKLFDEMYKAGFIMLFFGLESANDRILSLIEKGTDKVTEQQVLEDSSRAGIWNHTYMFFGFPTEEKIEAEETVDFIIDNSELRSGNIHSVGQSTFTLEKDSAVFHNPSKFSIDRVIRHPDRDMSIMYDYEIKVGMTKVEVGEIYERFNKVIDDYYPSSRIWKFLSREHFLLYLDKFGKEEIMNMASDEELVDA